MKKLESLKGSKFELSKEELNIQGGLVWETSYRYVSTSPNIGGCDKEITDLCWV